MQYHRHEEQLKKPAYEPIQFELKQPSTNFGPNVKKITLFNVRGDLISSNDSVKLDELKSLYIQEYQKLLGTRDALKASLPALREKIVALEKTKYLTKDEEASLLQDKKQLAVQTALLSQIVILLAEAHQQFPITKEKNEKGCFELKATTELGSLSAYDIRDESTDSPRRRRALLKEDKDSSKMKQAISAQRGLRMLSCVFYRINVVVNEYALADDKKRITTSKLTEHLKYLAMEAQSLRGVGRPWLKNIGVACLILTGLMLIAGGILALPMIAGGSLLPAVVTWAQLGAVSSWIASLTGLSASSLGVAAITLSMAPIATGTIGTIGFFAGRHTQQAAAVHHIASMSLEKKAKKVSDEWSFGGESARDAENDIRRPGVRSQSALDPDDLRWGASEGFKPDEYEEFFRYMGTNSYV